MNFDESSVGEMNSVVDFSCIGRAGNCLLLLLQTSYTSRLSTSLL